MIYHFFRGAIAVLAAFMWIGAMLVYLALLLGYVLVVSLVAGYRALRGQRLEQVR